MTGGLSGPAIRPVAVRCVWQVRKALPHLPILGMGGIRTGLDALQFILAGASAVSVGTAVFGDPSAPVRVLAELEQALDERGFASRRRRGRLRAPRERPGTRQAEHAPRTAPQRRSHPRGPVTAFGKRLDAALDARGSLCVGIDPHPALLDAWGLADDVDGLARFADICVEAFADTAAVIKPQSAFFEPFGARGIAVLERTVAACRDAGALVRARRQARRHRHHDGRATRGPTSTRRRRWRATRSR